MSRVSAIGSSETLGQRVKRLRVKQGVRQIDLAERAGISWRHLIRIEQDNGGITKPSTIASLAEALGVDAEDLAGESEDDEESDPVAALMSAIRRVVRQEVQAAST